MQNNDSKPSVPPGEAPPRRSRRKLVWTSLAIVLVVATLTYWQSWRHAKARAASGADATSSARAASGVNAASGGPGGQRGMRGGGAFANQSQPVQVAAITRGDLPIVITSLGTVTPLATVTVRTLLNGTLNSVGFVEGQIVKRGDFLAQIDPRPYEISLRNAQGQLAKDQALLRQAMSDLAKYQTLLQQDSIARQTVETQASLVDQYRGTIKSDQANIDTFRLDLIYARITAPVAGRVGLRQVDPGNYVTTADPNGIVVITQLQPISVIFTTSEDNLQPILKQLNAGVKMSVSAYDRSNAQQLETGSLETVDNQIDTTTGTVKLRATFPNQHGALFPNQFVNARLLLEVLKDVTIVPTSAVQTGSIGAFVYVVKDDHTVTVRPIKTGPVDGERTSVVSGLQVGEQVVLDGADRLREGSKVTIPAQQAAGASAASEAHAAPSAMHGHRRQDTHGGAPASSP